MVSASCPFFLRLPALLHFSAIFGRNFCSQPSWRTVGSTYQAYFGLNPQLTLVVIVFCGRVLSGIILRVWLRLRRGWPADSLSVPELMLAGGFLFYPALLVVLTKLLGSGYVPRYGWPAILGLMLWLLYLLGMVCSAG